MLLAAAVETAVPFPQVVGTFADLPSEIAFARPQRAPGVPEERAQCLSNELGAIAVLALAHAIELQSERPGQRDTEPNRLFHFFPVVWPNGIDSIATSMNRIRRSGNGFASRKPVQERPRSCTFGAGDVSFTGLEVGVRCGA